MAPRFTALCRALCTVVCLLLSIGTSTAFAALQFTPTTTLQAETAPNTSAASPNPATLNGNLSGRQRQQTAGAFTALSRLDYQNLCCFSGLVWNSQPHQCRLQFHRPRPGPASGYGHDESRHSRRDCRLVRTKRSDHQRSYHAAEAAGRGASRIRIRDHGRFWRFVCRCSAEQLRRNYSADQRSELHQLAIREFSRVCTRRRSSYCFVLRCGYLVYRLEPGEGIRSGQYALSFPRAGRIYRE